MAHLLETLFLWKRNQGSDPGFRDGEFIGLSPSPLLLNDQVLPMGKKSGDDILARKRTSNEIGVAIDLDISAPIHLSDPRDSPSCHRKMEMASWISVALEAKTFRHVPNLSPLPIPKDSWEAGSVVSLRESSVGFAIMVIAKKTLIQASKGNQGRTAMAAKHSLLPEMIKALHTGISTWFSCWDKDHLDPQQQVQSDNLGKTVRVTTSSGGCHLVVHLGAMREAQALPGRDQVRAEREGLFIPKLSGGHSMPGHIHGMKGVKTGDPLRPSKVPGTDQIGLVKITDLFGPKRGIGLSAFRSGLLTLFGAAVFCQDASKSRNGGNRSHLSLLEFPLDDLSSDTRKCRTASLVGFQLLANRQYFLLQSLRGFSPDMFGCPTLILESSQALFSKSAQPLAKPTPTAVNDLENLLKAFSLLIKLNGLTTLFMFLVFFHRRFLLPQVFGKKVSGLQEVHDVMT